MVDPSVKLSRRSVLTSAAAAAVTPAGAQADVARGGKEFFSVTRLQVRLASIHPSHDGLRIVQLSDLHIGHGVPEARVLAAIRAVNELKPDLVMLTGDFITTRADPVSSVSELLGKLEAQPVAVLGNHDHWTYPAEISRSLERLGVPVLRNQHTALRVRNADFSVIGIDDSTTRHDDVAAAFKDGPTGSRLVLTHTPSCARRLPEHQELLCLSGHTHGGQLEIPGLTAGFFRVFGQPWYRGGYAVRGNQLREPRAGLRAGHALPAPQLRARGDRVHAAPPRADLKDLSRAAHCPSKGTRLTLSPALSLSRSFTALGSSAI